jgi:hypothetical protein
MGSKLTEGLWRDQVARERRPSIADQASEVTQVLIELIPQLFPMNSANHQTPRRLEVPL